MKFNRFTFPAQIQSTNEGEDVVKMAEEGKILGFSSNDQDFMSNITIADNNG